MKKRSEVGSPVCKANCQSSETPGLAGCVARTEVRASRHKGTGACIDSTRSVFVSIGGRSRLFMNNPGGDEGCVAKTRPESIGGAGIKTC